MIISRPVVHSIMIDPQYLIDYLLKYSDIDICLSWYVQVPVSYFVSRLFIHDQTAVYLHIHLIYSLIPLSYTNSLFQILSLPLSLYLSHQCGYLYPCILFNMHFTKCFSPFFSFFSSFVRFVIQKKKQLYSMQLVKTILMEFSFRAKIDGSTYKNIRNTNKINLFITIKGFVHDVS